MVIYFMHKKRSGFMLAEAAVALLVAIITLGILNQSLQIARNVHHNTRSELLRWHITNEKLQNDYFIHADIKNVKSNSITFSIIKNGEKKDYELNSYDDKVLRLTTPNGGYMPILKNLIYINISKNGNLITIITRDKTNRKSEMFLINEPNTPKT
ncbi:ComGF family competence protein [Companilactobacillus allii]|uniref:Prepilin-type N-terminal cleavage/methylation domain-containing protein n=1 Tax=Companilactobacillus allii TaxID=1847728 RepID=A0A1P8Q3K4_9LACO|nr:competence type IV pilus minor pilin ComGF [Companilactobacillus allii]APX72389.1 hypothetical protein BTM29_07360 [Companilactobacillus allii]USQ69481.1 ComGF family competence protein [Companilactobacillus allii]